MSWLVTSISELSPPMYVTPPASRIMAMVGSEVPWPFGQVSSSLSWNFCFPFAATASVYLTHSKEERLPLSRGGTGQTESRNCRRRTEHVRRQKNQVANVLWHSESYCPWFPFLCWYLPALMKMKRPRTRPDWSRIVGKCLRVVIWWLQNRK